MALVSTKEVERGLTHAGFQPLSVDLTPRATPGGGLTPTALAGMLEQRGWSRNAALGMAANAVHESGGGFGAPLNPGAVGDNGNSYGLFQWNGPRRIALQQFASSKGRDWKDVTTQLDFLDTEVGQDFQDLKGRLNTSKTAAEAARMFVTEFERPADLATNLRVRTATAQRLAGERPSFFGETAPAALRRETGVGSVIAAMDTTLYPVDPNFDPIGAAAEHEDLMPYLNDFVEVRNRDEFQRRMGQIRTRLADDDTLAAAGWQGIVASVGAGFLDPINLVPIGGGAWKALRAGRLAEGALTGLGGGLIGAGLQEGLLSASQPTRTAEESALNIVSGGIGGAGLGVGAGLVGETASRAARAGYLAAGGAAGGAVAGGGVAAYSGQSLEDAAVSIGTGTVILGLLGGSVGAMARPGVSAKAALGEAAAKLDIETDAGNGAVYRDVREQLLAAGRPEAEADAGGSLWQAHIDAMAKATGESQEKLYRALGLDVRTGALPEGALYQSEADLPMDEASRMARAEAEGFTVDAYKGTYPYDPETMPVRNWRGEIVGNADKTPVAIDRFDSPGKPFAGFFSDKKEVASRFADAFDEGASFPTRLKIERPLVVDMEGKPATAFQFENIARKNGTLEQFNAFKSAFEGDQYDGFIARNTKDEGTVYVPRDPSQIRSRFAKFDPARAGSADLLAQDARGAVEIGDSMARITLSAKADASTFLHESGHVFLSHLDRLAKDTPGLAADAKVVRDWLGVGDGPLTVAAQEKWARGFEAYLRDGKAPTPVLQRAFDAFRDWLVSIYRSLADLDVELSDDVRAVMDRMLGVGEDVPDVEPGSLSAAVLQSAEGPDDLRIARGMEGVARVTSRIPGIAGPDMVLATSPTKAARRAMRKLVRPVVATVGDLAGRGASENVESNVGQWHGRLAVAVEQSKAVFVDYSFAARKAGEKWMHYSDFRDAVSSAGRRNDSGDKMPLGDEAKKAVSKVAAIYRREVFDPLLNEALRLGLMTQAQVDAARRFAESYIPRDWNIPKLVAERSRFTREVILPQVYADWEAAKVKLDSAAQISRFTDEQFREVEAAGRQHGGPEAAAFISEGPARSSTQMMRDNIKALEGAYNDPSVTWHEGDEARARDLIIKSKTPVIARDGMEGIRKGGPALDAAEAEELQNIVLRTLGMLPWDAGDSGARATRAVQAMKRWAETLKADGNAEESARVAAIAKAHETQTRKSLAQRAKAQRTLTAEDHLGRLDETDLPGVASDIFDGLVGHETNRIQYEALKIQQRGPMKEKTFNVRDTKVEEWLENDIEVLAQKALRTMAPDIELKRLTGDVNAETERQKIRLEYSEKAEGVPDGKEKTRLDKRQKADLEAFDGIVSRLRGTYGMPRNTAEVWGLRAGRLLKAYNFSRLMGSAVITQLSDIGRVMFMTKIGNLLGDAIVPLVSNWKAVKLSKAELKLADIATEIAKGNLAMRGAEIFDDYGHTTAAERFAQKSSAALATLFGLNHWNQGLKTVAGLVAQAKLAKGVKALAGGETGLSWQMRSDLSRVGVNEREAVLLQKYIEAYGKPVHGVMIPNTKDWSGDDAADAARLWRSAMRQLVDDQVINPGQDRALWMSRPLGSVLGQLETFNLVSTQRTLLVGLQRRDSAVVVGTAAMVGLGMLQFWIKAQLFGWAMPEDWDDWLGQGIKGSGLLAVLGSVENRLSASSRGAWSIDALTGSPTRSRYEAAGFGSLLGPTGALGETAIRTTQALGGGDWNWADTHRFRAVFPTQNFWIVRSAFTDAEKRFNDEFGIRNRQKQRKRN